MLKRTKTGENTPTATLKQTTDCNETEILNIQNLLQFNESLMQVTRLKTNPRFTGLEKVKLKLKI